MERCPAPRLLSQDTRGLRLVMDVVLQYEQRSDAVLIHLLGKSYTLQVWYATFC